MVDNQITLRDRLGGRWAISLRAYTWAAVPWIFVGALSEPQALRSPAVFFQWLGISAVAYVALGAVFVIAHKSYMRNRSIDAVPLWVSIGTMILGSEVRSLTYIELVDLAGLPNHVPFELRLATAAFLAVTAFPILTYAFDSWDRYVQERDRLIDQAVNERVHNLQQEQALEVIRLGILKELQLRVSESLSSAREDITKISEASAREHIGPDVVKIFSDISRGSIRSISHLLRTEAQQVNRFRATELISIIAHSRPYRPFVIMPALFATAITVLARNESFLNSVRLAWLWTIPALMITSATNWACRRFIDVAVPIYLSSVVALGLLGFIPYFFLIAIGHPLNDAIAWAVMGAFTGAVSVPISGLGDGISLQRQSVLNSLRKQVEQADIAQLALQRERNAITGEIASYMHGTVQATLSASIMRLSQALASGNQDEAVIAFNQAREALELPEEYEFNDQPTTLAEHLFKLKSNWAGLVNITAHVEGDGLNSVESRALQTIATEAINNAVRHGDADAVELAIRVTSNVIELDAFNNGHLAQNEKLGMGLKTLDKYASKNWSLSETGDGRVHLSARIKR